MQKRLEELDEERKIYELAFSINPSHSIRIRYYFSEYMFYDELNRTFSLRYIFKKIRSKKKLEMTKNKYEKLFEYSKEWNIK